MGRSAGHLSQVERGLRPVTPALITAYQQALGRSWANDDTAGLDGMRRRKLVGLVAAASVGAVASEPAHALLDALPELVSPRRVGLPDVLAVEDAAAMFMRADLAHGGVMAAQMGRSSLRWAAGLLDAEMSDAIRERLSSAVGLLADRLGWSTYDAGQDDAARRLLVWALDHAALGTDSDLRAHIMLDLSTVLTDAGRPRDGVEVLRMALVTSG